MRAFEEGFRGQEVLLERCIIVYKLLHRGVEVVGSLSTPPQHLRARLSVSARQFACACVHA